MKRSQSEVFVFLKDEKYRIATLPKDKCLIFSQRDPNSHDIYFLHNNFKILFSLSSQEVWGFFDIFYSPNLHNSYEGEHCLHTPCVFNVAFQVFQPPLQCLKFVNSYTLTSLLRNKRFMLDVMP